jgi:hypothetical protein
MYVDVTDIFAVSSDGYSSDVSNLLSGDACFESQPLHRRVS